MQTLTLAHRRARYSLFCITCGRSLRNAKYGGEFVYVLNRQGQPQRVAVYLTCQCRAINEASIDVTDPSGFLDVVEGVTALPHCAQKITQHPQTESIQGGQ